MKGLVNILIENIFILKITISRCATDDSTYRVIKTSIILKIIGYKKVLWLVLWRFIFECQNFKNIKKKNMFSNLQYFLKLSEGSNCQKICDWTKLEEAQTEM